MAENTIDTLSIEIKSDAVRAEQSIRNLADALVRLASGTSRGLNNLRTVAGDIKSLNNATKGLDTSKLSAYATGMDNLSNSIGRFADIGDKITPAVNALQKLAGVDLSGMRVSGDFSGLSALAEGAGKLADTAPKLAALKASDLNRSLTAFQKLGQTDFSGVAQSLQALNGLDVSGFAGLSQAMGTFATSAQQLAALGRKDMNAAVRNIERMGSINFSGLAQSMAALSGVDFSRLAALGQGFQSFSNSLAGAEQISNGTVRVFNSLALLAQAAGNLPLIISNLQPLSVELQKFFSTIATAPAIAGGTTALVSALAQLASSGSRIQKVAAALPEVTANTRAFIDSMSTAPAVSGSVIRLVEALSRFTVQGGRAGAAAGNLQGQLNILSGSMNKLKISANAITKSIKGFARQLLSLAGLGTGLYALIKVGRESIKTYSDLVEIQNVVDKSFGDMDYKVEELAKISIPDFGMSELTVKNISSRFQAMGVAMGFAQDEMSDMSIELTKLAADMASFYNVEQDMVAEKLDSIFTGTTRPLRSFGLDLSQTTLQEWALKQGLDANIKSMSQMEKTMLRYQYVMAQTRSISGDFKDTQLTMANQVRILKQSFEQLASVIGGALVNAFKPLIVNLNRSMQSIIAFAQTVVNALGKIFGWTYEIKGGGVVNDLDTGFGGIEDSTAGTAGNLGEAADNLEKMNKYIAAWHEVNNMTTDENADTGGSGGSGGGSAGGVGGGAGGELVKTESIFEKYKSDIDSLYELGEYIGKVLTDAMNSINWDKVYEGARNFGRGLADFLNGLISPELFGAVGRTIAGSLNAAIYAALAFGERFDWTDFGKSIATGINEFFKMFDFASLAKTINVWANGILDTAITALGNIEWRMIGTKIGTFLAEIDFTAIGLKLGQALWGAVNGGIIAWENAFRVAPVETTIITALATLKFTGLGKLLAGKISLALAAAFKDTSVFIALKAGAQALFGNAAAAGALAFMNPITKAVTGIGTVLGGATLAGVNFFDMWKNGFDWLNEAFMLLGITAAGVGAVILGIPAGIAAAVAGIVAAIGTVAIVVHDNWDAIMEWLSGIPEWIETNIALPLVQSFSGMCSSVSQFFSDLWTGIQGIWSAVAGWFSSTVIEPVADFFEGFSRRIGQIFEGLWILVQATWIVVSGWFNENVIVPVSDGFLWLKDTVSGFFANLWEGIKNIWSVVAGWFNENVVIPVTDFFRGLWENVYDFFSRLWNGIQNLWADASGWFSSTVIDPLVSGWKTATESIGGFFENLWSGIKHGVSAAMNAVIGAVESGCNFIVGSVNDILNGFNSLVSAAAKIAGLDWGGVDLIPEVSLPRVPALATGGVLNKATLALIGESGPEAVVPLSKNAAWMGNLSERVSKTIKHDFGNLQLDYSIPEPKEFTRQYSEADMGRLKTTLQMEMDEKMAQMAYENRQLRDAVEQNTQILEKILAQGIVLDDNTFTSKYKSASSKFYKQHRYEMGLYPAGR